MKINKFELESQLSMQCEIGLLCHFRGRSGDYCLQEEETMVQDRKRKSNAVSLGLLNNYGTSPLIFRAATFVRKAPRC